MNRIGDINMDAVAYPELQPQKYGWEDLPEVRRDIENERRAQEAAKPLSEIAFNRPDISIAPPIPARPMRRDRNDRVPYSFVKELTRKR